jgi:hypothetical protein
VAKRKTDRKSPGCGRVPIRLRLGYSYVADNDTVMYCLKELQEFPFEFLCRDEEGNLHKYTAKGRYFHRIGNHPLHIKREITHNVKDLMLRMRGDKK